MTAPDSQPAIVICQARERVEERLEVTLSGVAPSASGPKRGIKTRARTPADQSPKLPDGVVVSEGKSKTSNVAVTLIYYRNKDMNPCIERLNWIAQGEHTSDG